MKAYICDCCHGVFKQVIRIDTKVNYSGSLDSYTTGLLDERELCQECFNELNGAFGEIIKKHRELAEYERMELGQ